MLQHSHTGLQQLVAASNPTQTIFFSVSQCINKNPEPKLHWFHAAASCVAWENKKGQADLQSQVFPSKAPKIFLYIQAALHFIWKPTAPRCDLRLWQPHCPTLQLQPLNSPPQTTRKHLKVAGLISAPAAARRCRWAAEGFLCKLCCLWQLLQALEAKLFDTLGVGSWKGQILGQASLLGRCLS